MYGAYLLGLDSYIYDLTNYWLFIKPFCFVTIAFNGNRINGRIYAVCKNSEKPMVLRPHVEIDG